MDEENESVITKGGEHQFRNVLLVIARTLCEFEGKVAENTNDEKVSHARFALILKISLQFIAFFTAPFISEISREPAKISHQYAERTGEEKTCRGDDTAGPTRREEKKGCTEKRTMNADR